MKFLCPHCERLVELRDFKLDGSTLVLACPACQTSSRVAGSAPMALVPMASSATTTGERPALQLTSFPGVSNVVALRTPGADAVGAAADAARTGPFSVPGDRCPKCISPRLEDASNCASCGLTFVSFDPSQVEPSEWLKVAWVELLAAWDDEPRHIDVRSRAVDGQDLPALGRLYRLRLAAQPEDPIAQRGRDEVLRLALIPRAASPAKRTGTSVATYIVLGALLLGMLVALTLLARQMLLAPLE